jgi:hypothetical protein
MVGGSFQMLFAGGDLPSLAYQAQSASGVNSTTYNFAGIAIGTADQFRRVFVIVHGLDTGIGAVAPSSVTIAGIAATSHVSTAGTFLSTSIWSALVPTGATGNIDVVFSGTQNECHIGVWAAYDLRDAAPLSTASSTATTATMSMTTEPSCIIIGGATFSASPASSTYSGGTERYEAISADANLVSSGGDTSQFLGTNPSNFVITISGSALQRSAALSWR